MTAYDNHFLEAHIPLKKGGRAHIRLSPLNMTYLMAMVLPGFGENPVSLPQLAQQNRLTLYNLIDKMEFMGRTATQQGDTSFTLPPGWGESENEYIPPTPGPIEPREGDFRYERPEGSYVYHPAESDATVAAQKAKDTKLAGERTYTLEELQSASDAWRLKSAEFAVKEAWGKEGATKDMMLYHDFVKSGERDRYIKDINKLLKKLRKIQASINVVEDQTR